MPIASVLPATIFSCICDIFSLSTREISASNILLYSSITPDNACLDTETLSVFTLYLSWIYFNPSGINELKPSKIKKVERLLYHLNEGIEEPKNHPNQVYSLLLFLDLLKSHGITKIKVPTLQVLSYGYHELLSATTKEKFARNWDQDNIDLLNYLTGERLKYKLESYKRDLVWYNKVVEKQDSISKQKTENLINLFYRMECHIQDFIIRNDFDVQGDYLDIIIGNEKSLSK